MKWIACLTLTCLSACASVPASEPALCTVTATPRTALAGALVADGGPQSRRAGLVLIEQLDADELLERFVALGLRVHDLRTTGFAVRAFLEMTRLDILGRTGQPDLARILR